MDIVNTLRMLADDLHSKCGTNEFSMAMSTAADMISKLRAIPPHWQEVAKAIVEQDKDPSTRTEAQGKAVMFLKVLLIENERKDGPQL